MKTPLLAIALATLTTTSIRAVSSEPRTNNAHSIYVPEELRTMNLESDTSKWSYSRLDTTAHFAIFWEPGFGRDITQAPPLEGHNMRVNLPHLKQRLEQLYTLYADSLGFLDKSKHHYPFMVMLWYSLEGTAYGGDYDGKVGAFWSAPGRVQDERLNTVAHELGHSFQSQLQIDGASPGFQHCGGFYEMTSQWMLWQANPRWIDDETYHFEAFKKLTHKAFLDIENIYHSPFVLEYWSEKRGREIIADIWKNTRPDEDPVLTYMRLTGISQEEMLQEMHDCHSRMVNLDFDRVRSVTRQHANKWDDASREIPGNLGFNILPLKRPAGSMVRVSLHHDASQTPQRFLFSVVAIDGRGNPHYSKTASSEQGRLRYRLPKDTQQAWIVVTAGYADRHRRLDSAPNDLFPYTYSVE